MKNIFNRLLAVLVVGDNVYIFLTLLEVARTYPEENSASLNYLHRLEIVKNVLKINV